MAICCINIQTSQFKLYKFITENSQLHKKKFYIIAPNTPKKKKKNWKFFFSGLSDTST